ELPASVVRACTATAATSCIVRQYGTGGPGFLYRLTPDSYQAKAVLTYFLTAARHHVLKLGVDAQWNEYQVLRFWSGGAWYRDGADIGVPGTYFMYRGYGLLLDVDTTDGPSSLSKDKVSSTVIGGFIQDSWSIVDKVTLNVGLRYDTLAMKDSS